MEIGWLLTEILTEIFFRALKKSFSRGIMHKALIKLLPNEMKSFNI